jgi:wyosine [tRNA(Phe)-imidazoG37] synthetase (radical SAM superfamily)
MAQFAHVFGPVPSRRLGRSLGIDLVPLKTCTYDCIYCQLGRTTNKTTQRRQYAPLEDVLSEMDRKLATGPAPDYVTLSGSGEPTLYAGLADLIRGIRKRTTAPVAVLTNGSLMWDPQVREALLEADLVIPSLDAGDEQLFQQVNRPHPDILFEAMVGGIARFCEESAKPVWLEVFLLDGLTAIPSEVGKIARIVDRINPQRVQLNTVARPPAEEGARPVAAGRLRELAGMFGERAEVIADFHAADHGRYSFAAEADILNLLRRRPCSLPDLANGLLLHPSEAMKHLDRLVRSGLVAIVPRNGRIFYKAARQQAGKHDS